MRRLVAILCLLGLFASGQSRRVLIAPPPAVSSSDVTSGLIFQWKFNDGSGSTAVDSVGSANIALVGSPTWNGTTNCSFNGTSQAGSAAANLSAYNIITVTFWLNWTTFANNDHLGLEYTASFDNKNAFLIDPNQSTTTKFQIIMSRNTGSLQWNAGTIIRPSAGVWHFYCIVLDRTTGTALGVKCYLDGASVTVTQTQSIGMNSTTFDNSTLYLMAENASTLFGAGTLDDLRIYSREITSGEVTTLFNNGAK